MQLGARGWGRYGAAAFARTGSRRRPVEPRAGARSRLGNATARLEVAVALRRSLQRHNVHATGPIFQHPIVMTVHCEAIVPHDEVAGFPVVTVGMRGGAIPPPSL